MSGQPLRRILYLGLEPPPERPGEQLIHLPVIAICPRPVDDPAIAAFYSDFSLYTHALFTSKPSVRLFFSHLRHYGLQGGHLVTAAVGRATAAELEKWDATPVIVAKEETAEGLCRALHGELRPHHFFCWPHSALSRPVLPAFFEAAGCRLRECVFYDTSYLVPPQLPSLEEVDEIVFTSPSTVEGFRRLYGKAPPGKMLTPIGPVTAKQLFLLRD